VFEKMRRRARGARIARELRVKYARRHEITRKKNFEKSARDVLVK
jgi:hypothetical protein